MEYVQIDVTLEKIQQIHPGAAKPEWEELNTLFQLFIVHVEKTKGLRKRFLLDKDTKAGILLLDVLISNPRYDDGLSIWHTILPLICLTLNDERGQLPQKEQKIFVDWVSKNPNVLKAAKLIQGAYSLEEA